MKISFANLLADAWGLFRRDTDLLLRVAAPFLFLPAFAMTLLVPAMPLPDANIADASARAQAWSDQLSTWFQGYGLGMIAAYAVVYYGVAVIVALLIDPTRPDVAGALKRAARLFPRFFLAMILVSIPAGLGLYLLLIPGLYVVGRTILTAPIIVAEQPIGVWASIRRSLALSRGAGLSLFGLVALAYVTGLLGGQPFLLLAQWLATTGGGNPVAIALVDAAAALVGMLTQLALALIAVAAYRRLAR